MTRRSAAKVVSGAGGSKSSTGAVASEHAKAPESTAAATATRALDTGFIRWKGLTA